jgi:hypothetical protein
MDVLWPSLAFLLGGLSVWLVVRRRPLVSRGPSVPSPSVPAIGKYRVTRERDGKLIETLAQGDGNRAKRAFDTYGPERPGERIVHYVAGQETAAKAFPQD